MAICTKCMQKGAMFCGSMICPCEEGKKCAGDGTRPNTGVRICKACSLKLKQCEECRAKLTEAELQAH